MIISNDTEKLTKSNTDLTHRAEELTNTVKLYVTKPNNIIPQ